MKKILNSTLYSDSLSGYDDHPFGLCTKVEITGKLKLDGNLYVRFESGRLCFGQWMIVITLLKGHQPIWAAVRKYCAE